MSLDRAVLYQTEPPEKAFRSEFTPAGIAEAIRNACRQLDVAMAQDSLWLDSTVLATRSMIQADAHIKELERLLF